MLFGYPIAATAENWLHECLLEMVQTIHANHANHDGRQVALAWPAIIPAAHRDKLHRRMGLHDRLAQYAAAAGKLSVSERQQVLACLVQQNRIADLITCSTDCDSLSDLPKAIQAPVAELFGFAFELLTGLGVRDRHYHAIYTAVPYHVCPFCGCEYFDALGAPREDLDHYLPKSLYPFAAANLRNLVPMGMKCNERYKLAQDILRDAAGVRRRSFDPYADRQLNVVLDNSVPFGGADGQTPDWQMDCSGDIRRGDTTFSGNPAFRGRKEAILQVEQRTNCSEQRANLMARCPRAKLRRSTALATAVGIDAPA